MKRKQFFHGIRVLFSTFCYLHLGTTTLAFPNDSNPKEVSNDFICAGSYFSAHILEENVKKICREYVNAKPSSKYPARLEDNGLFGSVSDSLITGSLRYINDQYLTGHIGNSRIVIDMDCRFFGVVIYRKNKNPEPCIELSYPIKNSVTSPHLNYFEGYNCTKAVFSDEYVKRSLERASEIKTRSSKEYPRKSILNGRSVLKWPLFAKHDLYKLSSCIYPNTKYFLLFTESGQMIGVREHSGDEELECQPIKVGLVPHGTRLKSLHTPDTVDQENAVRYDCDGEIFRGYYVTKNVRMATDAHNHYLLKKNSKYNYPTKLKVRSSACPSGKWQWPLRRHIAAIKATPSISSVVLVFNRKFSFLGVYYVRHREHIKCNKYFVQESSENARARPFPDLNVPTSCCLHCMDNNGCCCPETNETFS
ncbi:BgtE-20089 [Blumeria graminis f. sp. tritici]|uniref:BgtE-20089 n=3 Tax=Blumeria graminis f. sp. tritici TaxID=62690 RepID=A0A9X9L7K1_BLUGR|nr:BgtE-20089 [Blumeria graminis f. sp. tritici]